MSTYKEINGSSVQYLSSDPPASHVGQVWYNTSTNQLKFNAGTPQKAWVTKAQNPIEQYFGGAASSSTTNGVMFGAQTPRTSMWDGAVWTTGNPITNGINNNPRYGGGGAGASRTDALYFGGYKSPSLTSYTEKWNGTTWTNVNAMPEGKFAVAGAGKVSTAAIAIAGYSPPGFTASASTYVWNGSSWTAPGVNINRGNTGYACAFGPSGASLLTSGDGGSNTTELWNGSSWTSNPNGVTYNKKQRGGDGTQTSAIVCGGYTQATYKAEIWNGSTWSNTADLISQLTDQDPGVFGGSTTSGFVTGGPQNRTPANSIELQTVGGATVLD
jgi:hypothetical protein